VLLLLRLRLLPPARFAGAMAKRLASLGALLQGDQRAVGAAANLRSYDVENQWARKALGHMYDTIMSDAPPMTGVKVRLAWR
jgi:hypothetical protein